MKKLILASLCSLGLLGTNAAPPKAPTLKTDLDSLSYAFGVDMGQMFVKNLNQIPGGKAKLDSIVLGFNKGIEIQPAYAYAMMYAANVSEAFNKVSGGGKINKTALLSAFSLSIKESKELLIAGDAANSYLRSYESPKVKAERIELLTKNREFMANHAQKEGVKTTQTGLQYQPLKAGDGTTFPQIDSQVTVSYKGMLTDGTVFDQGEGVTFGVNQVIAGWTEGLQLMSKGEIAILVLPPSLAYGEKGAGDKIKPNSVLVFEVTLIEIK